MSAVAEARPPKVANSAEWTAVCKFEELLPGAGVAALVHGRPLAIFRLGDKRLFAIGNVDPFSGASVLSRGIVGDVDGEPVVASPIFKQHFRLDNGRCIEDATVNVPAYRIDLVDGIVVVEVPET